MVQQCLSGWASMHWGEVSLLSLDIPLLLSGSSSRSFRVPCQALAACLVLHVQPHPSPLPLIAGVSGQECGSGCCAGKSALTKHKDSNACYHSDLWNAQSKQAHPGDQLQKGDNSFKLQNSLTDRRTLITRVRQTIQP